MVGGIVIISGAGWIANQFIFVTRAGPRGIIALALQIVTWALMPQTAEILPEGVAIRHITRPERSSPAEGYPAAHRMEQERIVTEALE